jgi:hypothetical protein
MREPERVASTSFRISDAARARLASRAALAVGPDVWEIIARLQELDGSEEQRISLLAAESDLHPRLIRIALDYAAEHPVQVRERIERNRAMAERSRQTARQREALLA